MNVIGQANSPPEELDALLRAFYRSEMPHPWPEAACGFAQPRLRRARGRSSWWNSRLALAASIALLLLGSLLLSGASRTAPRSGGGNSGKDTAKYPVPRTPPK